MGKILSLWGYFGGKSRLAERLADRFPYKGVETFVDAFAGSGAVTLNKPAHKRNICNDLNLKIYLVLKALSQKQTANEFIKRMYEDTEYSKECFETAFKKWEEYTPKLKIFISDMLSTHEYTVENFNNANNMWKTVIPENDAMDMAVYAMVLGKQSYNGLFKCWKGIRKGDECINYENSLNSLRDIAEKLEGIEVYNVNSIMLINKFKNEKGVCFYLDPPYEMKTRGKIKKDMKSEYEIEMPDDLQLKFIEAVKNVKGPTTISGYKREGKSIYDVLEEYDNWKCIQFADVQKSSSVSKYGEAKPVDTEYLWYNS